MMSQVYQGRVSLPRLSGDPPSVARPVMLYVALAESAEAAAQVIAAAAPSGSDVAIVPHNLPPDIVDSLGLRVGMARALL